jgi:SAM-dependent methyltransferase
METVRHQTLAPPWRVPIKAHLKKLVPANVRLWRYAAYEKARYYPELIFSLGSAIECPFCKWHFRRLRPGGFAYPVLEENQVIGASPRSNVVCPRCKSHDRERLLYLFIRNETDLLRDGGRVLHMAPEPQMSRVLRNCPKIQYISADLFDKAAMMPADLLDLPFRNKWFDAVICNHVLEHVDDDRQAMRELHRVLKPGGWAILQVPIALKLLQTIEDPSVKDEQERIRRFGQRDHVRMYSPLDYPERLRQRGFEVSATKYAAHLGKTATAKYALTADEIVYFCRKAAA